MKTEIEFYGYTHLGGKKENEDAYGIRELENGISVVVADGLGGHGGGRQAADIAVQNLINCGQGCLPDPDEMMGCLVKANEEILAQRKNRSHMKTTVVFFCLKNGKAVWAHIGDSRLYHYDNWELEDYTLDHSVSQMAVSLGEIRRYDIPGHADRSRLLRVLGEDEIKPAIQKQIDLGKGFHAFLMCTDGFWEYVTEDEMLLDLSKSETPREWIYSMQERHERRVSINPNGNHDNHTAIAVFAKILED